MTGTCRKVAFVSGKGGVGKTALAANFAFCSSTKIRTVLIDFDFQNQGSSGLLAQYAASGCLNSFHMLTVGTIDTKLPVQLRERLYFVPAFDPDMADRYGAQIASSFDPLGLVRINHVLDTLLTAQGFDLAVIDCHGGLDDISFATFISSDTTFIVTEADKVTFSGTLELFDFYFSRATTLAKSMPHKGGHDGIDQRLFHVEQNKCRILVNRVTGSYDYENLKEVLAHQLYENIELLSQMNEGFSFFPRDPLLAESFSEYPFFVELLPEAIFSQKLELLVWQATGTAPALAGRAWFYKWIEQLSPHQLERYIKSPHDARVQSMLSFIAITEAFFTILMIGSALALFAIVVFNFDNIIEKIFSPGFFVIYLLFGIFSLYVAKFNFQISGFFRDRLRYEIRLYRKGARRATLTFAVRLVRLVTYRACTVLWAVMFAMGGIVYLSAPFLQYVYQ